VAERQIMPLIFFHKALSDKIRMLLSSETKMPMMYMDDAIATIQIMQAPKGDQNSLFI
jgi:hypothetical protein